MLEYDWDHSLGYWLCLTSQTLRRALNAELARENITIRQWEVLACLALAGGELTQVELAERLGVEAPTLNGLVDRMVRGEWLERRHCDFDRRRRPVRPTAKAELLWKRMVACAHRVRARAVEGLCPEDISRVKAVCERIRQNLDGPEEPQAEGVPAPERFAVQTNPWMQLVREPAAIALSVD
jgi:MarR family transcriptional regulator for hemolysin